jgi:uncharacterized protein (DUF427 family)
MSLTRGDGPLSTSRPSTVNYDVDGPGHLLFLHPFPRRLRGELGGEIVFDTTRAQLLHESNLLPVVYVPLEDVRPEAVERTDHETFCPFKGRASYWTLRAGGEVRDNAVWGYEEPLPSAPWLAGLVAFYADRLDRWYDEDEPVRHVRDPYHRVDARRSSRHVRVTAGDAVLAESARALLVSETGAENRWYLPLEDVQVPLTDSDTRTHCPYKGDARYFHVHGIEDAAWAYEDPLDGVSAIRGLVSFAGDGISVRAD